MDIKTLRKIKIGPPKYRISLFNLALIAIAGFIYMAFIPQVVLKADEVDFTIQRGDSLRVVAQNLKDANLIKSKTFFTIYALVLGRDSKLGAGKYFLSGSQSTHSILFTISDLRTGANDVVVTIPEGYNVWEIDQRLSSVGLTLPGEISKFITDEGFLFPETYRFTRGETPFSILETMSDVFLEKTGELKAEAAKTNRNWGDIIKVASLIEKEARHENDMRIVSDIIWKRLDAGVELKIDAAVAYGYCRQQAEDICEVSKVPVRAAIDELNNRYNTYKFAGLPPTPISNPGVQSIRAAMNPKDTPYWYYLSTRDGRILFSKTGDEHEAKRDVHILGL